MKEKVIKIISAFCYFFVFCKDIKDVYFDLFINKSLNYTFSKIWINRSSGYKNKLS